MLPRQKNVKLAIFGKLAANMLKCYFLKVVLT